MFEINESQNLSCLFISVEVQVDGKFFVDVSSAYHKIGAGCALRMIHAKLPNLTHKSARELLTHAKDNF